MMDTLVVATPFVNTCASCAHMVGALHLGHDTFVDKFEPVRKHMS